MTTDYDPTGNPLLTPTQGPLTDFRCAGMFYHTDSGLYLAEHRPYDPRTGRWLTRDPLGEGSDPAANLYRYVQGNPISLVDPLGLDTGGMGYSYVPPGGYWSPGNPFPPPPGDSGSPCPPGDDAAAPPPTVFTGAADDSRASPDGGDSASGANGGGSGQITGASGESYEYVVAAQVTFGHGAKHVDDPEAAQEEILENLPNPADVGGWF